MAITAASIDAPDRFAQRARWRAFHDPSVEADYRQWHQGQIVPIARLLAVGSLLLWGISPIYITLVLGHLPPAVLQAFVVAEATFVLALVASYTRLVRWANTWIMLCNIVIGLNSAWVVTALYGPGSGTVAGAALAFGFYPLVIRLSTGATAWVTFVLMAFPLTLLVIATQRGDVDVADQLPYIGLLAPSAPLVVVAAAQIEAGMRRQFHQQRQLEESRRLIRRYAPAAVATRIESGDAEAVGIPQRIRVTALSSDIAGFTALADRLDPESLSHIVNEYVAAMSSIVEGELGVVTEFAGDGMMAIFGAPEQRPPAEQVRSALAAADGMHRRLAELNDAWGQLGTTEPLAVRIGINTGVLSVGSFGSDGRATYTAIGLHMNIAARIQAQCEPGQTLLSNSSWHLIKNQVRCEPLGAVMVKGVHFPIEVYAPRH